MQQVWISIIVSCFLLYEGIQDLISKKIVLLPGIPILIIGIVYNIFMKIGWEFWVAGFIFSITVCVFSYISRGQIGMGDGLILFILSPLLGKRVISIFFLAIFLCAMLGIILMLSKGITKKERLPLIPFMMAAYFIENAL